MNPALKSKIREDLLKSIGHLEFSFRKVHSIDLSKADWDEAELETLESFSSRFARTSDLYVSRYLRALALESDPAFRGSLIDLLNLGEKQGWIDSARQWYRIRELRNVAAHEYSTEQLGELFRELFALTPQILKIKSLL